MLNAELTEHLGYEKNEYVEDSENYRNGFSKKVHSSEGAIELNVSRDRQGTFEPIIVEKGQKIFLVLRKKSYECMQEECSIKIFMKKCKNCME